jgi:hypothetical protein
MKPEDRAVLERLRGAAERHRRLAAIHVALGEDFKAAECLTLAEFEEARAERLERRLSAA